MYFNNEVTRYLQSNKILALKLDHALAAVRGKAGEQFLLLEKGATRLIYYTSCFTDEYQDVCKKQKTEDIRFGNAVVKLLQDTDVVKEMLKIYFDEIFKYKSSQQLEHIKEMLLAASVHIAASNLTGEGFSLAVATTVCVGMNLSLEISAATGRAAGFSTAAVTSYGIIQNAADSARRLHVTFPAYYAALYAQELEMMYFLIEPLLERSGALHAQGAPDSDVVTIISRMIR